MKTLWIELQYILSKNEKGKIIFLFILMLLGGLLEMAGVSLVLPMIGLITKGEGQNTEKIAGMALILILVYIGKNLFLTFMYAVIFRFIYRGTTGLSGRMMEAYLKVDYSFHLNHNVAKIERAVSNDSESVYRMMKALLQLFAEALICVVLAVFLLFTDVVMSLFLFLLLGSVCGVFLLFSKKGTKKLGREERVLVGKRNQVVLQAFGGIKEVKLLGREEFFLKQLIDCRKQAETINQKQQLLLQIPRLMVETVCIAGVMAIILFHVAMGNDLMDLIPKLSVFAVAAFRLLPSVGKINSLTSEVLFFRPAVDAAYQDLKELEKEEDMQTGEAEEIRAFCWGKSIQIKGLDFRYREDLPLLLSDVDMEIKKGSAVGVIGPSGAGKTTLVDLLMGMLKPTAGKILADEKDIQEDIRGWQRQIGYVPQSIYLSDDSIRNNVAFGLEKEEIDDQKIWNALEQAQLADFVRQSADGLDTEVGDRGVRLSGGQRQRIGIARALYHDPELLVFDEATSALDTETEDAVMQAIEALHGEKTLIIIAHRLSTIKDCDTVYRVMNGKVTAEEKAE